MKHKIIKKNSGTKLNKHHLHNYDEIYNSFSWDEAEKTHVDFFSDGTINAAYNTVDRHVRRNKTALIFHKANNEVIKYTFTDLAKESNKFANVLVKNNIHKGDRVFIFLPTIPERYIAFLGTLKMGGVAGTMFAAFQEVALMDRLKDSEAKILVTNTELYPRIEKIWKNLTHLEKVILIEDDDKITEKKNIISYRKAMNEASGTFSMLHLNKNDLAYILYTSGTTGKPKGIVHSHGDILQAIMTTKYVLDVHDDDIYWCTADLGWVTGVVYGVLGIWGLGATSVIFEGRFSPEAWYKVIEKHRVSVWYCAPTAIRMLMASPVQPDQFDLTSLRHLASIGEPLNPEAITWGIKAFGLPFHDTWFQTEQGSIAISNFPSMDIKPGSMGKPFPGIIAGIIDDQGNELPPFEEGHLALKSETVKSLMKGVWKNEEKFKSYFLNEWYLSGDHAYRDNDGYFWFVGREDDVIKTAGERIGPFEVESVLVEHPQIIEAGVIGLPDEIRGEIIMAFIVLKPDIQATEELKNEIVKFVKGKLAGHAYPRKIKFIEKLPKTRSGKIMRRLLKAQELGLNLGDTSTLEDF